jgi:hypothetical protein
LELHKTSVYKRSGEIMEKILLISLFVIEIVAFAWLILEAKSSRRQRQTILEVEQQILKLERVIISMEKTIIKKLDKKKKWKNKN